MVLINGIMAIATCILGLGVLQPLAVKWIPGIWANVVTGVVMLIALSPFLRAIAVKKSRGSQSFDALWAADSSSHAPLLVSTVIRSLSTMRASPVFRL